MPRGRSPGTKKEEMKSLKEILRYHHAKEKIKMVKSKEKKAEWNTDYENKEWVGGI